MSASEMKISTTNRPIQHSEPILSNYSSATLWLGLITILVIPPFSVANVIKGHFILALICFSFMVLLVLQCVMISKGRYSLKFTLAALVPAITLYIFFQIYTHGIVGVFWSFPASMVLFFILPLRHAILGSACLLATNAPLIFFKLEFYLATSIVLALLLIALFGCFILTIIERQQQQLKNESEQKRHQIENLSSQLKPAVSAISQKIQDIDLSSRALLEKNLSTISSDTSNLSQRLNKLM